MEGPRNFGDKPATAAVGAYVLVQGMIFSVTGEAVLNLLPGDELLEVAWEGGKRILRYRRAGKVVTEHLDDAAASALRNKLKKDLADSKTTPQQRKQLEELLDSLDAPKGKYRGGLHGSTKSPVGDGLESHHMPPKSVNRLHPDKGPAIQMDPADHALTASHGTQPGSDIYRLRQQRLINQGKYGEAIQMDIDNIRKLFGNKYDEAIKEMIEQLEPWMKKGLKG